MCAVRTPNQDQSQPVAWQPAEFPGLEILRGLFRQEFPRHYHDGLMVSVTDSGAHEVEYKGTSYVAGAGQVVAMAAGEVHAIRAHSVGGWRYRVFYVPYSLISLSPDSLGQGFKSPVVINDGELAGQLRAAHTAFAQTSTKLECEERLQSALSLFFDRHAKPGPVWAPSLRNPRAVRRAVEYLSEHCERNVALAELAAAAELDGFLLTREFTRSMGIPPHAYHLQRRIRAAQGRLAGGESVTDVAQELGFSDQAHLTRLFKRHVGVTPGRYRSAHGHHTLRR
jgi:AraC-like DNA-binding protein